jgi:two-component system, NtrC family, nitrogen regulation sensor histidine kinase NtrY
MTGPVIADELPKSRPLDAAIGALRAGISTSAGRPVFGVAYAVAFLITVAAIWLVAIAPEAGGEGGARAAAGRAVLYILLGNLVLILTLASGVGIQVLDLIRNRKQAGARLHLRFVTLFSLVAVVPAVLIALVFGVLVNRGVDQWFSQNVQAAVENGADIGRAYITDVSTGMDADLVTISDQLQSARPLFEDRIRFTEALIQVGEIFGYAGVYILDSDGAVLAGGVMEGAPAYVAPPRAAIEAAAEGGAPPQQVTENPDAVRSLYALPGYGDSYLYLVKTLQPGLVSRLQNGIDSIEAYREAQESRARIQTAFALSYLETALLVLVGAVWLGMAAASAISVPIGRLAQAADQVAGGDLSARVVVDNDPHEIAALSNAFNRMTSDLQTQQEALRAASEDAQGRSRFIETVLSGVSAGVIGLDRKGRVSAINASAIELLGLPDADLTGRELAAFSSELSELLKRAEAHIEEDIDVTRDGETRRLRVRIEGGLGGEMVLTFDDITRLVTAQRNAAWRDVARRIAHEIKNPLTPIQLSAERLRRKYRSQVVDDVDVFDRCTETIIRQVGDIGRMVDEFSSFARMPAPRFAPENPAEILRQAVFAQRVAVPDVTIDLQKGLPKTVLQCDGRMVGQALTNILKNAGESVMARRAMTGDTDAGTAIRASLDLDDTTVTFIIEDDGVGLPEKDRDRLTEPYVTTRDKGTGLGLAIVRRICEDHGGELKLADAETLHGARMCLIFPLKAPSRAAPAPASPSTSTAPAAE